MTESTARRKHGCRSKEKASRCTTDTGAVENVVGACGDGEGVRCYAEAGCVERVLCCDGRVEIDNNICETPYGAVWRWADVTIRSSAQTGAARQRRSSIACQYSNQTTWSPEASTVTRRAVENQRLVIEPVHELLPRNLETVK